MYAVSPQSARGRIATNVAAALLNEPELHQTCSPNGNSKATPAKRVPVAPPMTDAIANTGQRRTMPYMVRIVRNTKSDSE